METKMVNVTIQISESCLEWLIASVNDRGGQIFVEKALKFEDEFFGDLYVSSKKGAVKWPCQVTHQLTPSSGPVK